MENLDVKTINYILAAVAAVVYVGILCWIPFRIKQLKNDTKKSDAEKTETIIEKQKEYMQQLHELNEKKLEDAKAKKYGVEDLFEKNKQQQEQSKETEQVQEALLVEYKENFFTKVISKIKNFLQKKKK